MEIMVKRRFMGKRSGEVNRWRRPTRTFVLDGGTYPTPVPHCSSLSSLSIISARFSLFKHVYRILSNIDGFPYVRTYGLCGIIAMAVPRRKGD